jgi:site-specific recombinase XerD
LESGEELQKVIDSTGALSTVAALADIPEEDAWLDRGFGTHSMRATFITTVLENGCSLEDVQRAADHAEPGTTKLYDRRCYNPEKSARFSATY